MNELQKLTTIVSRNADALGDLKDTISTFKAEEEKRRIIRVDGRRMISLPLSTLNCIKC